MVDYKNADYQWGEINEHRLIAQLDDGTRSVRRATKFENTQLDIDVWVSDLAVSIKCQHLTATTGKVYFECEVKTVVAQNKLRDKLDPNRYVYKWEQSWFHTGRATYYLLDTGENVYWIDRYSLHAAIDELPHWFVNNRPDTVNKQIRMGHSHHDARGMLIPLDALISAGLAVEAGLSANDNRYYQPEGLE